MEILVKKSEAKYYDQGWIARVKNQPFRMDATIDWKDGWRDADETTEENRLEGAKSLMSVT